MEKIRLAKYFTDCGVMSRRAAEAEIAAGRVLVNGSVAEIGDKIEVGVDEVIYKGKKITPRTEQRITVMLNKPRGIVCTASDEKRRKNVTDLCSDVKDDAGKRVRLYPVGRLDMDSDGLVLLTNDGNLANRLTHPRHSIPKIYEVTLRGKYAPEDISRLGESIELDGRLTMPVKVTLIAYKGENTVVKFELFEGRNRQIRRMCEYHGVKIDRLSRVAIGSLKIGQLAEGKWRYLTDKEIEYLTKS